MSNNTLAMADSSKPNFDEFESAILADFLDEWKKDTQKIPSICSEIITQCRIHLIHLEAWFSRVPSEQIIILAVPGNAKSDIIAEWKKAIASWPRYSDVAVLTVGDPDMSTELKARLAISTSKTVVVVNFDDFPKVDPIALSRGYLPNIVPWSSYLRFEELLSSDHMYPIFVGLPGKEIVLLQVHVNALSIILIGSRISGE